jgi:hypothetical protein
MVVSLIDNGVIIDSKNGDGLTPLMMVFLIFK